MNTVNRKTLLQSLWSVIAPILWLILVWVMIEKDSIRALASGEDLAMNKGSNYQKITEVQNADSASYRRL